jgi:Flp pilus assembly protein TadD
MKAGKADAALAPLQRAVTMAPSPSPLLHLAEALAMTGRKDEARSMLSRLKGIPLNAEQKTDEERIAKSLQ